MDRMDRFFQSCLKKNEKFKNWIKWIEWIEFFRVTLKKMKNFKRWINLRIDFWIEWINHG